VNVCVATVRRPVVSAHHPRLVRALFVAHVGIAHALALSAVLLSNSFASSSADVPLSEGCYHIVTWPYAR
jgi:hypothetical protein